MVDYLIKRYLHRRSAVKFRLFLYLASLTLTTGSVALVFPGSGLSDIPDAPGPCGTLGEPLEVNFVVEGVTIVNRVELEMAITHSWVGDLIVELEAPDLTRHLLFGKTGALDGQCIGDSSNLNGYYRLTDDVSDQLLGWWAEAENLGQDDVLPENSYRTTSEGGGPNPGLYTSMNEIFNDVVDPNGIWTLYVYDNRSGSVGQVTDASLIINPIAGQISDGSATYRVHSGGTGLDLQTDIDYLYAMRWFYRLNNDNREYQFPEPDFAIYHSDTVTITWLDVDDKGFRVDFTHVIDQTGLEADQGILTSTMKITNFNANDISVSIFSSADFDINGSGGDQGQLVNNDISHIRQVDDGYQVEFRAGGNDNYQIGSYNSVIAPLEDDDVDNLLNIGNGFGPNDVKTAFQWFSGLLPKGFTYQVQTTVALGGITAPAPVDPVTLSDLIFADGFSL